MSAMCERPCGKLPISSCLVYGHVQVVLAVGRDGPVGLLASEAGLRRVAVLDRGCQPAADDRVVRRQADPQLPPRALRGVHDRLGGDLGLEDRRDRLRVLVQPPQTDPAELRRVQAGQVDDRQLDVRALVHELAAQRLVEPLDRVLGGAVGRLQRDAAPAQRRADLHDRPAVARAHHVQRGEVAVDAAEVRHLGDAPEVLRGGIAHLAQDGGHRVVDPDIDRAELALDAVRGLHDAIGGGDVERQDERPPAGRFDIAPRALEPGPSTGDQPHVIALLREAHRGRPPDPGRSARDDHDRAHEPSIHAIWVAAVGPAAALLREIDRKLLMRCVYPPGHGCSAPGRPR